MRSKISRMLKQRGHEVVSEGGDRDILVPQHQDEEVVNSLKVVLYNLMRRDSTRKAFRDWAYENESSEQANRKYIQAYVDICERLGTLDVDAPARKQFLYAHTFEWYISELLCREFSAHASGFNLRLKDADPNDEYDCIAIFDGGIVFVECKTGKGEIYSEIRKFRRRDSALNANYSWFLFDRDYTFARRGEDPPKLDLGKAKKASIDTIAQITVGPHRFFEILCSPEKNLQTAFLHAQPSVGWKTEFGI